jgi:hypothetical protein
MVTTAEPAKRGEVHLVRLDPKLGSEIRKTRPCLIVSPDELNLYLRTAMIAPMTTGGQAYPLPVSEACGIRRARSAAHGRPRAPHQAARSTQPASLRGRTARTAGHVFQMTPFGVPDNVTIAVRSDSRGNDEGSQRPGGRRSFAL